MKKLLSILSVAGVLGASSSTVVSCSAESIAKASLTGLSVSPLASNATHNTAYEAVFNAMKAKGEDVTAPDIENGSESKNVTVTMQNQNKNSIINDDELFALDKVKTTRLDVKIVVKNSIHFKDGTYNFSMKVEDHIFNADDLNNANYDGDILYYATNADIYNNVRQDIAEKAGFTAEDIKTGTFKDDVLVSIWNEKTQLKDNSDVTFKDTTKSSTLDVKVKFANDTNFVEKTKWVVKQTKVEKLNTATEINYTSIKVGETPANIYKQVRTDLAKASYGQYADDTAIQKSNVGIALWYNGKMINENDKTASPKENTKVQLKLVINDDKVFADSNGLTEIQINVVAAKK